MHPQIYIGNTLFRPTLKKIFLKDFWQAIVDDDIKAVENLANHRPELAKVFCAGFHVVAEKGTDILKNQKFYLEGQSTPF